MRGGRGQKEKNPSGPASWKGDILPNSCCADLFTEFTHACVFNTRSECEKGCVCVCVCGCRVCVCVCAHSCLLVSMAAVDQALGTLEGAAPGQALGAEQNKWKVPLLSSPSLPPPTRRRAPEPFPVSPSSGHGHLAASRGVRPETTRRAAVCPESVSQGARGRRVLVPCLLPGSSRKGRTGSFPGDTRALGCYLSPRPTPRSPPGPSPRVTCSPARGPPSLTRPCCPPGPGRRLPGRGPRADPTCAKDSCHDFGQIISRVTGPLRPRL